MVPFLRPAPPRLSQLGDELREIEGSGIFSNYGPTNARFEAGLQEAVFRDGGACVTVCNATIGLMMAMRAVIEQTNTRSGMVFDRSVQRFALMPSFTFAAAAQAADWIGLTPLFCDIDEADWASSMVCIEAMIARYGRSIAVIVPYATFGNCIDLGAYERLSARTGIPVVVDGAASLGSRDAAGRAFAAFSTLPVVFSMHATKTFSTSEGGVIHSADPALIRMLRVMGNFGFGGKRSATMPGLNSKLSEVGALLALAQLRVFEPVVAHHQTLAACYRAALPGWTFQRMHGTQCAHQFMPVLIPPGLRGLRDTIVDALNDRGIGTGVYFSPHVAAQPFFRLNGLAGDLSVTERVSAGMVCLPLWNEMSTETVAFVCDALQDVCRPLMRSGVRMPGMRKAIVTTTDAPGRVPGNDPGHAPLPGPGHVIVGGGPAGLAPLLAASRNGRLAEMLAAGLVVVDRQPAIGFGHIGRYVINSDSSAQTFLSCLTGNPEPRLAALLDHPTAQAMGQYGHGAVPLFLVANLMERIGAVLTEIIEEAPGCRVMACHDALSTRRSADGGWLTTVRCLTTGAETVLASRTVLMATGGWQPATRLATQSVAGNPLLLRHSDRLVQSDQVLTAQGRSAIAQRLRGLSDPRIVVIGGSTSALSCVRVLLEMRDEPAGGSRNPPPITVLHRQAMKPFYPSAEQARSDGYTAFGPEDICPVSGFVHRFGGLRFDSRHLLLGLLGLGGVPADPRVRLQRLGDDARDRGVLDEADLVVAAFGYRPCALPVLATNGDRIVLNADLPDGSLVGAACGVLDDAGAEITGLFGIGLAAGFRPTGALGGEASFKGQVNGLWLWQNDVGALVVGRMVEAEASFHIARRLSEPKREAVPPGLDRSGVRRAVKRDSRSVA